MLYLNSEMLMNVSYTIQLLIIEGQFNINLNQRWEKPKGYEDLQYLE